MKMVSFYAFLEIFIDTVTANRYERKLTLTFKFQKINSCMLKVQLLIAN